MLERLRHATLGNYDVAMELGRGGMAAVYLAHDLRLDRKVAIKVMLPELTHGEEMVERFRREARTAGNLSHPHIIPIHDVHDEDGLVFFVMKFVEGRSLDSVVRELGPLPIKMVETILTQSAGALAYAHRKGVIHRDIKPANIMLDEEGWAVVTDFGIAKVTDAAMLTTTGSTMGTPYYMSPEQCSSKPVTGASDQYSLGVTCYELLTGSPPFNGPSLMEVMSGHFFTAPTPIRQVRPECPHELEAIVMRMLEKNPEQRFAHLNEVVSALKAPTLAHDDPVREQMIDLARSGAKLRERLSVPISPIPAVRPAGRRPSQSPRAGTGEAAVPSVSQDAETLRQAKKPNWIRNAAAGVAVIVVAAVAVTQWPADKTAGTDLSQPAAAVETTPTPLPALGLESGTGVKPASEMETTTVAPTKTPPPPEPRPREPAARTRQVVTPPPAPVVLDTPVTVPEPQTPAQTTGRIQLATRTPGAMLYLNGEPLQVMGTRPQVISLQVGRNQISLVAEGCTSWDTTITVVASTTQSIGRRELRCGADPRD